jgi:hypothetical protein
VRTLRLAQCVAVLGLVAVGPVATVTSAIVLGGPAPDVAGGPWIGSEPLTLSSLRGRVVLVEFWTYG